MKITRADLIRKSNLVNALLTKEELEPNVQSKLKYAIQRSNKKVEALIKNHQSDIDEISIRLASEDKDGNLIVTDKGGYAYSKSNEVKRRAEIKQLEQKEEVFEPYLFTDKDKISTFDKFIQEELAGFFFDIPIAEDENEK